MRYQYKKILNTDEYQKIIIFNNSHESDGFTQGVSFLNEKLEKNELRIKLQFIEDFESDDGEFAWAVSIVPDDLPVSSAETNIN